MAMKSSPAAFYDDPPLMAFDALPDHKNSGARLCSPSFTRRALGPSGSGAVSTGCM
jgi:hypothetical protein